ncbi:MAG: DUF3090 family protein [Chloroflexota bacterium]|nr:DUF3090 family protein [Chloroflexota bacterium]
MARRRFVFDSPSRVAVGTVGQPGQRAFFLQARQGRAVLSVALEKVQVALLAERMGTLLEEVGRRGLATIPDVPGERARDTAPLDEPVVGIFRVGTLALAWDADASGVLIEARAETPEGEDDASEAFADNDASTEGPDLLRLRISPDMAVGFIERAQRVLAAGRPPCPLCGLPLNPEGHICPRGNGSRLN